LALVQCASHEYDYLGTAAARAHGVEGPGRRPLPHAAGVTRETVVRVALAAVRNASAFLTGGSPRDVVIPGPGM